MNDLTCDSSDGGEVGGARVDDVKEPEAVGQGAVGCKERLWDEGGCGEVEGKGVAGLGEEVLDVGGWEGAGARKRPRAENDG